MKPGTMITKENYKQLLGKTILVWTSYTKEDKGVFHIFYPSGYSEIMASEEWQTSIFSNSSQVSSLKRFAVMSKRSNDYLVEVIK